MARSGTSTARETLRPASSAKRRCVAPPRVGRFDPPRAVGATSRLQRRIQKLTHLAGRKTFAAARRFGGGDVRTLVPCLWPPHTGLSSLPALPATVRRLATGLLQAIDLFVLRRNGDRDLAQRLSQKVIRRGHLLQFLAVPPGAHHGQHERSSQHQDEDYSDSVGSYTLLNSSAAAVDPWDAPTTTIAKGPYRPGPGEYT